MTPELVANWRASASQALDGASSVDRLLDDDSIVLGGRALATTAAIARLASVRLERIARSIEESEAIRIASSDDAQLCATSANSGAADGAPQVHGIAPHASMNAEALAQSIGESVSADGVVGHSRASAGLLALVLAALVVAVLVAMLPITRGSATDPAITAEVAPVSAAGVASASPSAPAPGEPAP